MRGVHFRGFIVAAPFRGSSPHARGPLNSRVRLIIQHRIIPACAGSTKWHHPQSREPQDHPRMRGVHLFSSAKTPRSPGSSPHARGPPMFPSTSPHSSRIIPACAGSTPEHRWERRRQKDHPRMRGVHTKKSPEKCHS